MPGGSDALAQDLAESTAWRDLRVRVASAVVLAPLGLAALWLGGPVWNAMIVLLAAGMAWEWSAMCAKAQVRPLVRVLTGVAYIAPASVALIWLRGGEAGRADVLFVLLIVWASDIGAYLAGRLFGGPRLAPRISPGKTWSGAIGGLVAAALVGVVAALLVPDARVLPAALLAACLGIASQTGDLLESALKRRFGVKDSGRLIPGHGGLLDRLDGMLLAAPLAALMALALGHSTVIWQ